MVNVQQSVPGLPQVAMVDKQGNPTGPWYSFFVSLWNRTGGPSGTISAILDNIASAPGSLLYRAASLWQGLAPGNEFNVLQMGTQFPDWGFLNGNNFGPQAINSFFIGPASGSPGEATFRDIETADLVPIAGEFPGTATNDNASAGNIGEYIVDTVLSGSAVNLTTSTAANIASIALTKGDWDVSLAAYFFPQSGASVALAEASLSETSATSNTVAGFYSKLISISGNGNEFSMSIASKRFSLSATTTIYFVAFAGFSGGTLSAFGELSARRAR